MLYFLWIVLRSMEFYYQHNVTGIIYGNDTKTILTYSFSDRDFTNGTKVRKTHFTGLNNWTNADNATWRVSSTRKLVVEVHNALALRPTDKLNLRNVWATDYTRMLCCLAVCARFITYSNKKKHLLHVAKIRLLTENVQRLCAIFLWTTVKLYHIP